MLARLTGAVLLAAFAPGCLALPLAVPPGRASIGLGAAIGNPLPLEDGAPMSALETIVPGRVGVTVQSAWPEQHRRPIEVEAGYSFQLFTNELRQNRNRHGAFLGVNALLGHVWIDPTWRLRVVLRGAAEVFALQAHPGDGGGGSWALGFELAHFERGVHDAGSGPRFLGVVAGEWGFGLEALGGVYSVGGAEYGIVAATLVVRWPALAGIAILPLSGTF